MNSFDYPYFAALLIGLMGASHCIAMCGGISSALSLSIKSGEGYTARQIQTLLLYNTGRLLSYGAMGLLVGIVTYSSVTIWAESLQWLRILAGTMLICMGLYVARIWLGLLKLEKAGSLIWQHLEPFGKRVFPPKTALQTLLLGSIWGWLPCGLVYSTLIYASAQASPWQASGVMLCFGLGTLPAVIGTGLFAQQLNKLKAHPHFSQLMGLILIGLGLWTLPIPYTKFF
ncbi:TRAP transporter, DctM-like membrane protein [Oleiphilus messinensis]|uniref:TRAP transporter, DctM-like membrane protein n=1 Tax=Oleiphilus messinensis TaxID=141451 RepID=A0A1Y0I7Z3_9GAMM|nr:sulfite exporter TauE/SafE family protein [Oleiphilus messinensis]ARU56319.1 TRAP transporter, DctM-like membrane protein [Oleiphilus messinensis]